MARPRRLSLLAIGLFAGLSAKLAAQGVNLPIAPYYTAPNSPFAVPGPNLTAIQDRLNLLSPGATLAFPPAAGLHTASDTEYVNGLTQAEKDLLAGTGPAIDSSVTVSSLFDSAASFRPTAVPALVGPVTKVLIAGVTDSSQRASALMALTASAVQNSTSNAVPITASIIAAIAGNSALIAQSSGAAAGQAVADTAVDAAAAAVTEAASLADKITATAILNAQKASTSETLGIVQAATTAALQNGASNLIQSIASAAVSTGTVLVASPTSGAVVLQKDIFGAVLQGIATAGATSRGAILEATLGAIAVSGTLAAGDISAMKSEVMVDTSTAAVAIDTYEAIEAALAARKTALHRNLSSAEASAVAVAALHQILTNSTSDGDAAVAAALAARPMNAVDLLRKGIQDAPGLLVQIVDSSVRTLPSSATTLVGAAINQAEALPLTDGLTPTLATGVTQGAIVQAAVGAANSDQAGAITVAGLRQTGTAASPLSVAKLQAVVTGAVQGAESAGYSGSIASLTAQVATAFKTIAVTTINPHGHLVVSHQDTSMLIAAAAAKGASVDDPLALAGAVAGVISVAAVPSKSLGATQAGAKDLLIVAAAQGALSPSDTVGQAILAVAANTIRDILATKSSFYSISLSYLSGATDLQTQAVVLAAGVANPAGLSAVAAAALQQHVATAAEIEAAATGADRALAPNVQAALDAVSHVGANGASDLYDYVGAHIIANIALTGDIVTGAIIAAPEFSGIIAHAAALRAPQLAASKVVPAIFAFGQIATAPKTGGGASDGAARAAAIMAAITAGIIDAKLDRDVPETITRGSSVIYNPKYRTSETAVLKANVVAVVKAALLLTSPTPYPVSANVTLDSHGHLASSNSTNQTDSNVGPAGAITGLVAETTTPSETDINLQTVGAIVQAAAAAAGKLNWITIAQAAAQAFVVVSRVNPDSFTGTPNASAGVASSDGQNIVAAILNAVSWSGNASERAQWVTLLEAAVSFGAQQAKSGAPGIGAKGVVDYAHASGTGSYVSNIFDL